MLLVDFMAIGVVVLIVVVAVGSCLSIGPESSFAGCGGGGALISIHRRVVYRCIAWHLLNKRCDPCKRLLGSLRAECRK